MAEFYTWIAKLSVSTILIPTNSMIITKSQGVHEKDDGKKRKIVLNTRILGIF